nr:hypothetical protein [Tanacetum cinerariifolium]
MPLRSTKRITKAKSEAARYQKLLASRNHRIGEDSVLSLMTLDASIKVMGNCGGNDSRGGSISVMLGIGGGWLAIRLMDSNDGSGGRLVLRDGKSSKESKYG